MGQDPFYKHADRQEVCIFVCMCMCARIVVFPLLLSRELNLKKGKKNPYNSIFHKHE